MDPSPSARRILSVLLAAALVPVAPAPAANLTREEATRRREAVARVDYEVELHLHEGRPTYRGRTTVRFSLAAVPRQLFLDFQGEEVTRLVVNGQVVPGARPVRDRLDLPRRLLAGGRNTAVVEYVNEFDRDGAGLHRAVDPVDGNEYLYTQMEPFDANRLLPCFDQPDLKATYRVTVTAPPHWEVVTNAPRVSSVLEGERRVHRFAHTPRFSTYLVALCAGPFATWTDPRARVPSRLMAAQSMARHLDHEEVFEVTRQGFRFFERWFGISYPFAKYDQVFVPQFNWGAMENVGLVILSDRSIFRHRPTRHELVRRADLILHEMAHMWFGDLVTMEWWNDLWLNESFATYTSYLALAEATRYREAWEVFERRTKGWAYWQDQLPTTHPIETEVPDTDTSFTNFDGITYGKGAAVLKQLAFYVGEEAFRKGVSRYLKEHRWGNARREDFIAAVGETARMDLTGWTRLWLQAAGVNTITPELEVREGRVHRFFLVQEEGNGARVLRPHRLQVALYRRGVDGRLAREQVAVVRLDGRRVRVRSLEGGPAPDFVDADHGGHAYAKVFLDPASLVFARAHLEELPGTALRGAVWRALWFMVRDGAVAPADYLDLFGAKAPQEEDPQLVGDLEENLEQVLDAYLPEPLRSRRVAALHALADRRMAAASPGSDLQRVWFDLLVRTAEEPPAQARLAVWLEGRATPAPGLELDQELRWSLVEQLCRRGHVRAPSLLAAESDRDETEHGARRAAECRAALPDPAGKAAAWAGFVADRETPLALLRAGMSGFWQVGQEELLAPYVERYFEALPGVAASGRGDYFVESFAGKLFPEVIVRPGTLARTRRFLREHPRLAPAVRRELVERAHELEKALTLREAQAASAPER